MQLQPLQSDDRRCVVNFSILYTLISELPAYHMNANIFVFFRQAMNTFGRCRIHFAHHNSQALAGTARACKIAQALFHPPDFKPGLFLRLATSNILDGFHFFDHADASLVLGQARAFDHGAETGLSILDHFWVTSEVSHLGRLRAGAG